MTITLTAVGGRRGNRQKHPKKDLEALLVLFDEADWRIARGKGYFKLLCPCGSHKTTVHLSPSDPNYVLNKTKWLQRQPCYKDAQEDDL